MHPTARGAVRKKETDMAMDLTGLGAYTDYMTDANRVNTENLQKKLENKEMDKSTKVFSDEEDEEGYASNMVEFFSDTVIQQISSQTAAEQSNSLAHMLYEQAKRNYNL